MIHSVRIDAGGVRCSGAVDDLFPWWSFTKTVLALCALRLVEQGALSLDTPMAGARFTLREVLQHRAGLGDYGMVPEYHAAVARGDPAWSRDRMVAEARAVRADVAPGVRFSYSNIGYRFILEEIERVRGAGIGDAIRDLVTAPLGLETVFAARDRADMARQRWAAGRQYDPGWVLHGVLIGSARDAARLLDAVFAGRVLGPGMLARMIDATAIGGALRGRVWDTHGYGLGMMAGTVAGIGRVIGHSGGGPFSVNACYRFPDLPAPCTVVCFGPGPDEAGVERAAVALARDGDM